MDRSWFNTLWLGFFLVSMILGVRHFEVFGGWEGKFVVIVSIIMIMLQDHWRSKEDEHSK